MNLIVTIILIFCAFYILQKLLKNNKDKKDKKKDIISSLCILIFSILLLFYSDSISFSNFNLPSLPSFEIMKGGSQSIPVGESIGLKSIQNEITNLLS